VEQKRVYQFFVDEEPTVLLHPSRYQQDTHREKVLNQMLVFAEIVDQD